MRLTSYKMPKEKRSISVVLRQFVKDFPDFTSDGKLLFCKYCEVPVAASKKFQVTQHIGTAKHQSLKKKHSVQKHQILITTAFSPGPKHSKFNEDLCKAFISADIPLNKLSNPVLKGFLEQYTKQSIPHESTLRKNYVSDLYNVTLDMLRGKAKDNGIWVSLDETSDVEQRCVVNFVFGVLGVQEERDKSYLLTLKVLDRVNHSTIAAFFNDCLNLLWPDGILYDRVLLAVTDAAPYMCKALGGLQVLYPKMIHVTCLAHGLHRVAEQIRASYPDVNLLISSVKKIFLKAPSRVEKFREIPEKIPLPPAPVVTRWGTWINAAIYYAQHFDLIRDIVNSFNPDDAHSIQEAQEIFLKNGVCEELAFIKTNFACLSDAIKTLETRGLLLSKSIEIVERVNKSLNSLQNNNISQKLTAVLKKNTGYHSLKNISELLHNGEPLNPNLQFLNPSDCCSLEYAPIVSCDVERIFSEYKLFLSDNRRKFTFENILHHVVIKCNRNLFN